MSVKRSRAAAYCLVVVWLVCLLLNEFSTEVAGLIWRIRHGRTVQLKSLTGERYAVEIPALWWPKIDDNNWGINLVKMPGRFRGSVGQRDFGDISFSLVPQYETAEKIKTAAPLLATKGFNTTEIATVRVAGQDLHCFDDSLSDVRVAELTRKMSVISLMCVPLQNKHLFSASYAGSRALEPEFYKVLYSIKKIR